MFDTVYVVTFVLYCNNTMCLTRYVLQHDTWMRNARMILRYWALQGSDIDDNLLFP